MCAILDASVLNMVFGPSLSTEGTQFFKWLNSGKGRLVIGGKTKVELYQNGNFARWAKQQVLAARLVSHGRESKKMRFASVVEYDDTAIEAETRRIEKQKLLFESNDLHVIALARVSGARLLYSKDGKLQQDFKNEHLVHSPRGKVYSNKAHQHLLDQNLCRQ